MRRTFTPKGTRDCTPRSASLRSLQSLALVALAVGYQHFAIKNADYLHAGLGVDFPDQSLSVDSIYGAAYIPTSRVL